MVDKMSFDEFVIKYKGTIDQMGLDFQPYVNKGYSFSYGCESGEMGRCFIEIRKRGVCDNPFSSLKFEKIYFFPKKYYDYVAKISNEMNNNFIDMERK